MSLQIISDVLEPDLSVPKRYTNDGENLSPPLNWSGVPEQAKELALVVEDPDAPRAQPFVHWVLYKIPADSPGLPEGLPHQTKLADPPGVLQGVNSFDKIGYDGPAPPRGLGAHHYHFRLFALDQSLDVVGGLI
jgi:Raf kinase inhibitor-like YbhB/YbcL family protein